MTTRRDGRVSDVHDASRGMDIHHGLDGSRRISVQRRDGSRLVAERGRPGYVQRGFTYHGHDFQRRAYYDNGREYDRFYRGYGYRGVTLNVYAPGVYFAPAFYGWAYNPWAVPIAYGWGWAGTLWLGFYGGFFTPYAVYPSAAFWLTDYLIAADLQAAYAANVAMVGQAVGGAGGIAVPANQPWTDAGTALIAGQTYTIAGSGVIRFGSDPSQMSTPAGRSDISGCRPGERNPNAIVAPGLPCNGLVAKIGPNGAPFPVGMGNTVVAPASGELYFGVNDCIGCFGDNSGTWVATVIPAGTAPGDQTAQAGPPTPLTPEVKQLIADEIRNQLALENAEAAQTAQNQDVDPGSSGIARIVDDVSHGKPHMFVVGDGLDVANAASGQECHVSDGDALQLTTAPAADATAATVVVKASKGGVECAPGSMVSVNLTDLQEMQNHMRENIDVGLKELQSKQGQGGLPQAPASAQAAPAPAQYAALAPPPSPQDAADIQAQTKEADQAEAQAQSNP